MKKTRPLGAFSDYIVETLPHDLQQNEKNVLPTVERLIEKVKFRTFLKRSKVVRLAMLDLKIAEKALEVIGENIPVTLYELVSKLSKETGMISGISYEEIIIDNPESDLRLFTTGKTGESERYFYLAHKKIEVHLSKVIEAVQTIIKPYPLPPDPMAVNVLSSFEHSKLRYEECLVVVKEELAKVFELTKSLRSMSPEDFSAFRKYLTENKQRGTKGPSGAFTAKIPIMQLLAFGTDTDLKYLGYVKENKDYFPKCDLEMLLGLVQSVEAGLLCSLNRKKECAELVICIKNFLTEFRGSHYGTVKKLLLEVTKGTAGENPSEFLVERIRETKKLPTFTGIPTVELAEGYNISRIIKGCWQFAGGHGLVEENVTLNDMQQAVESDITTFDCADIYTGVEELIGKFRQSNSDLCVTKSQKTHTKFVPDRDILAGISKEYIESIISRCAYRLNTPCIDLVQFHWWDFNIGGWDRTFMELIQLQKKGKIRHLGLTNFDVDHTKDVLKLGGKIISNQVQYSILDRRPENGMTELALKEGFRLLCYGTLAGGFLSARYLGTTGPWDTGFSQNRSLVKYKLIIDDFGGWDLFQELLGVLKRIGDKHSVSLSSVASRYVLEKPAVAAVIIGSRNSNYAEKYNELFRFSLDTADYLLINAVLQKSTGPKGDIYSVERDKDSPHYAIMRYNLNRS